MKNYSLHLLLLTAIVSGSISAQTKTPTSTRSGIIDTIKNDVRAVEHGIEKVASTVVNVTEEAFYDVTHMVQLTENALVEVEHEASSIVKDYISSVTTRFAIEKPDSYSYTAASVTKSPEQETELLAQRKLKAHKALMSLLNLDNLTDVPTIGFCGSGGGVRALYETLGWLCGADSLGILDTIQYAGGLSGSTWALNPWVASQLSPKEYKEHLIPCLSMPLTEQIKTMTTQDMYDLLIVLGRKYYNKQQLSPIDLYGAMLSHIFLRELPTVDNPYQLTMSALQPQIKDGSYPLILSTSVLGANTLVMETFGHKPTYEFSVGSSGSFEVGCFVPTWSLGRSFSNGNNEVCTPRNMFPEASLLEKAAKKIAPGYVERFEEVYDFIKGLEDKSYYGQEVPLGYLMGICGSAFSTDVYNGLLELYQLIYPGPIKQELQKPLAYVLTVVQDLLEKTLGKLGEKLSLGKLSAEQITTYLQNHEFAATRIPNLSYLCENTPLEKLPTIALVDGGFDLMGLDRVNIGIVPLLNRDLDLIFICDSSGDMTGAPALRAAERLARKLNLPFPQVSYDNIDGTHATLIVDKDPHIPIIVYMPGLMNEGYNKQIGRAVDPQAWYYEAQYFNYSQQQAEDLAGLIEYNVLESKETLLEALQTAVSRKNSP